MTTQQGLHWKDLGLSLFTHLRRPPGPEELATAESDPVTAEGDPVAPGDEPSTPEGETSTPGSEPRSEPGGEPSAVTKQLTVRRIAGWLVTTLALLLVLFALLVPDQLDALTVRAFLRIPVEGLLGIVVLLLLPNRVRPVVAVLAGVFLGLLTVVKLIDMGFYDTLSRPFDVVLDGVFISDGLEFLTTSIGHTRATAVAVGIVLLIVVVLILMTLSVLRLTHVAIRNRQPTVNLVAGLGIAWVACAVLGVQFIPGEPVASNSAANIAYANAVQMNTDLHDKKAFAREADVDPFAKTPPDQLLTGLKGKDVLIAFVESYGLNALTDPKLSPPVDAALAAGNRQLSAAGFASESGFLTSPTAGGGSFLAHSTLLSGLWIDNQQRYNTLVDSDRLTLTGAFQKANWRTVAVVPDTTRAWPEGSFFGYDKIYAAHNFGYKGPAFGWAVLTDQFALGDFQKTELSNPNHAPVMAEMALVSSHAPWAPLPSMVPWNQLGDGSIFAAQKTDQPTVGEIWKDPNLIRSNYSKSVAYTISSLVSYMTTYGNKNTVLVFLGDHQPAPVIVGDNAKRQVPITIVAKDPAVLKRISSWGWNSGLKPGPKAPVMPMNDFRNRFLTAFGSQPTPQTAATPAAAPQAAAAPAPAAK